MSDTKAKKARIAWHAAGDSKISLEIPRHVAIMLGGHFKTAQAFDLSTANSASMTHLLMGAIGTLVVNAINSSRAKGDQTPAEALRDFTWGRVQDGSYPGRRGGSTSNMPSEEAFRTAWLKATAISLMNQQNIAADKLDAVLAKIRANEGIQARMQAAWDAEAARQATILEAASGLDLGDL